MSLIRSAASRAHWRKYIAVVAAAIVVFLGWRISARLTLGPPLTVGVVQLTEVDNATFQGFKAGMTDLGYVDGENIRYRHSGPAGTIARLGPIIAEHLAAHADLLFVSSTPAALAAKHATAHQGIPVVFAPVNDPVSAGVVESLQSPGGNVTGIRLPQGDAMRLQWLQQVVPNIRRVVFPHNPQDKSALESLHQVELTSGAMGLELLPQPVPDAAAIAEGLRNLPPDTDAILLPRDSSVESHITDYVDVALKRKLPLCAPSLAQVHAGALLSYGFIHYEIGRQAAHLAHQIVQGIRPADLPVETARSYLAINLKTAQAIGLTIPSEVLRNAHLLVR